MGFKLIEIVTRIRQVGRFLRLLYVLINSDIAIEN